MRPSAFLVLTATLLAACTSAPILRVGDDPTPAPGGRRVDIYASVIEELVGAERLDWRRVYVVTTLCDDPADPKVDPGACGDVLSEAEQRALVGLLEIDRVRFVDDPADLYDDRWMRGPPRDVVVMLGPIVDRGEAVRVGGSYGCGGLCGSGTTYVLERKAGVWSVVGRRGPMWIA